nr:adenylate/guanylate cyclase domain-containing protein [Cognatishimia sp. F0-27]
MFKKRADKTQSKPDEDGERRQLTVLFYDIVGSTSLVTDHDPEDLRAALNRIHIAARNIFAEHGGSLEQVLGDGGMVYFGWPDISEDAALQSVEAALALLDARAEIPLAPDIRIGIATSVVVMSTDGASASAGQLGAVGVAPNLASRLESVCGINEVLVSAATHALTHRAIRYTAREGLALRGFPDETRAWRATGRIDARTRFARDRDASATLSGRASDIDMLAKLWSDAETGAGTAILIEGEPGIGKSRMAAELIALAKAARVVILQCQPRTEADALFSVIRMYDQAYEDGADDALAKAAVHCADALGALEERETLSPEARRNAIIGAVSEGFIALARQKPLLLLAEDLHWADEVTLAALERLACTLSGERLLLVATSRPSDRLVDLREYMRVLDLGPIDAQSARALIASVAWTTLTDQTRDWIIEKGDGNPLFLIELTAHACDVAAAGGALDAHSGAQLGSLRDLLAARLESAGRAKRTAQIASVLGRDYPLHLLVRLTRDYPPFELDADLQRLNDHGLKEAINNGEVYQFRHALIRDVAYDSQLRAVRRRLHGQIVDLVDADPSLTDDVPAILLAEHCLAADRVLRGIGLLIDVADDAIRRSALHAPRALLERALTLAAGLDASDERDGLRLRAIALLGPLVTLLDGHRAAASLYDEGQALYFERPVDARQRFFPVLWGWWFTASDLLEQTRRSEILIRYVPPDADRESRLQALHCGWATLFDGGAHDRCLAAISEGLALYDPQEGARARHLYGHDARVCGLGERALCAWLTGSLEDSAKAIAACEIWSDKTDHLGSRLHGLDIAMQVAVFRHDLEEIDRILSRIESLAGADAAPAIAAKRQIFRGWRAARAGNGGQIDAVREGLRALRSFGVLEDTPFYADIAADIAARDGQRDQALGMLEDEIAQARETGLTYWLPELLRRKAVLSGGGAVAGAALEEGATVALEQGAHMLLARNVATWHALSISVPDAVRHAAKQRVPGISDCPLRTQVLHALDL